MDWPANDYQENRMDRVVIVTGAGNGIGLAMTRALLEMGDRVAALDLSVANLEGHSNLLSRRCDVTDPVDVSEAVDEAPSRWDTIDILVNNACLALFKPFGERTPQELRCELEVNYFGYLNAIRAVLPFMRRQHHGVIHNMSSGVGFTGMPGMIGYTASKGAIESMTRTLALELADEGIVVNVMHPPLTRTKSAAGFGIPPEMMADPEKVGHALARKVGRTEPCITPDLSASLGLTVMRHFPVVMGKLLTSLSNRARQNVHR